MSTDERAAEVNWRAIAENKDRELRAVGEARHAAERRVAELEAEVAHLRRPPIPTLPQWLFDAARGFRGDVYGTVVGFASAAWVAAWEARGSAEERSDDPSNPSKIAEESR